MRFRSSYSVIIVGVFMMLGLQLLYSAVVEEGIFLTLFLVLLGVIIITTPFCTYYVIKGEELLIYVFVPIARIHIKEITAVQPMKSVISSPAVGPIKDRKKISWGKYDDILISPKDWDGFLAALLAIQPSIQVKE